MNIIYIKAYVGALVAFCIMDGIWLGVIATDFYFGALGDLLRKDPNWIAAGVFYLGYIMGIVYFVIRPSLVSGNAGRAVRDGALLGLMAYATYDMTNMATLNGWSLTVTLVDMIWGMVITGASSFAGYFLASRSGSED